jgi:hypothetical protein
MTPIEKAIEARRNKIAAGVKIVERSPLEKWKDNPTSLRMSINAKCYDCSNSQTIEIKHCTVKSCPLWLVRPYQEKL